MLKKKFSFLIIFLILIQFLSAQTSQERIKASMLYYLCGFIEWPEATKQEKMFTIGVAGESTEFFNELQQIAGSGKKINGKNISIQNVTISDISTNLQVLYVGNEYHKNIETILAHCEKNSILMITDGLQNNLHTVINFFYNSQKQAINFEVNKQNIILSKLNYKDDILLFGGNLLDVKELYHSTNKLLESEAKKAKEFSDKIEEKDKELQSKNYQILNLNQKIDASNSILHRMSDSLGRLQVVLNKRILDLHSKQQAIKKLISDYKKLDKQKSEKEDILKSKEKTLHNLDIKIIKREKIIKEQNHNLRKTEYLLHEKNKSLFIVFIITILCAAIGIIFIIRFRTKNRYNKLLEIKVEERTQELQKSEQNYREIFNGVSDYIFIQNEYGKIIAVNDPMLKAYGYTLDEIDSIDIEQLSDSANGYTNEKAAEMFEIVKQNGQHAFDWIAKRKNGETFWAIVILRFIKIGGNNRLLAVVRDIDLSKKNELELELHRNHLEHLIKEKTQDLESVNAKLITTNDELFEKNEIIINQNQELKATLAYLKETQSKLLQTEKMASLGTLTAGVAHEINNPLNYIMGSYVGLEMIHEEKSYEENNEKITFLLQSLLTGVERASNIVKGLNQFSRDSKSYNEDCDIHSIIDNCLLMLNNQLKNRIEIEKKYDKTNSILKGNVGNLHQVFMNIFGNAADAIEKTGVISIVTIKNTSSITIEITDTGMGISKNNLNKITDPFFTTKDPGKGTGLGLAITYNIIKEHHGTIDFSSEINKGTTVIITLPC